MDAANPPRVLDVRAFVESRAPEVSTLLNGLQAVLGPDKLGAAALPRHLRRRAGSYHRRVRAKRPNIRLAALFKRPRTTPMDDGATTSQPASTRPTNRAMRRRPARLWREALNELCLELQLPEQSTPARPTFAPGGSTQGEQGKAEDQVPAQEGSQAAQCRRLETHAWHARRMRMCEPLWGHHLPDHAAGRGKGSRSFLHHLKTSCVVHDASYNGCLRLSGHQRDIAHVLEHCSDPKYVRAQLDRAEVLCGAVEWTLMLRTPAHTSPAPAPPPCAIAPVRALWVPRDTHAHTTAPPASAADTPQQVERPQGSGFEGPCSMETQGPGVGASSGVHEGDEDGGWYPVCDLWLWVHPAAFRDCAAALQDACKTLGLQGSVSLDNLSQHVRRIDLAGPRSETILHQALQSSPTNTSQHTGARVWASVQAMQEKVQSDAQTKTTVSVPRPKWQQALYWVWPDGCVVGLTVTDPQLAAPVRVGTGTVPAQATATAAAGMTQAGARAAPGPLQQDKLRGMLRAWPESGDWTDGASQLLHLSTTTPHRPTPTHTGHDQGPPTNTLPLPHDPAAVASMRRAARRAALCLPRSEPTGVSAALQEPVQAASDTCPVLLVHRRHEDMPVWSLIVPRGWVMPFWLKLMHTGARAAGLREWRWVCSQLCTPCFPWDYPHTHAHHNTMATLARSQARAALRRPPGRLAPPTCLLPYIPWPQLGQHTTGYALSRPWSHASMGLGTHVKATPQATPVSPMPTSACALHGAWTMACTREQVLACVCAGAARAKGVQAVVMAGGEEGLSGGEGGGGLVWAWVALAGKGRCLEGAQIVWSTAGDTTGDSPHAEAQLRARSGPGEVVLGYVTTCVATGPRSEKLRALLRSSGPAGLAVVHAPSLARAVEEARVAAGKGLAGLSDAMRGVHKVVLRNPGSPADRNACLRVALSGRVPNV